MTVKEVCEEINKKAGKKVCHFGLDIETDRSRYNFLAELEGDILSWRFSDPAEEKIALELIKKIQKYRKYLRG